MSGEWKKGNIACHKSEARGLRPTARGTPREPGFGDEAFWRSQVNFGPPNPATEEKALWSKGKHVRCHTPCPPKVPRGRARRSRATPQERIPHEQGDRRRPSRGTSRPTGRQHRRDPVGCVGGSAPVWSIYNAKMKRAATADRLKWGCCC